MTENADLQSRMHRELAEAQQQLREKVSFLNLFRYCNNTVLTDLQEEQMANDAEIHFRLQQKLREKVNLISCTKIHMYFSESYIKTWYTKDCNTLL